MTIIRNIDLQSVLILKKRQADFVGGRVLLDVVQRFDGLGTILMSEPARAKQFGAAAKESSGERTVSSAVSAAE